MSQKEMASFMPNVDDLLERLARQERQRERSERSTSRDRGGDGKSYEARTDFTAGKLIALFGDKSRVPERLRHIIENAEKHSQNESGSRHQDEDEDNALLDKRDVFRSPSETSLSLRSPMLSAREHGDGARPRLKGVPTLTVPHAARAGSTRASYLNTLRAKSPRFVDEKLKKERDRFVNAARRLQVREGCFVLFFIFFFLKF